MTTSDQRVESIFRSAQAAAKDGQRARARRLLWTALQLEPERADLWMWLAGVASSPRVSLAYLTRALALEPHNSRARAGLLWARRKLDTSASELEAVPSVPSATSITVVAPTRPSGPTRGWLWIAGVAFMLLVTLGSAGVVLFPRLSALAADHAASTPIGGVIIEPARTAGPLPTRTRELPATWTLTPTKTATPTKTTTPTASLTPTPTETAPPSPTWVPTNLPTPVPLGSRGERWIDVNLSEQLLTAYEGWMPVRWVSVSTGLPGTPTVTGRYQIYVKYLKDDMSGDDYYLPGVPYVMYFYKGYGLHGTYWHSNFGHPMSHGCVNLPTPEAEWLFGFASLGTVVNLHY